MATLDLLCSPPGTGKTAHCIELFKQKILRSRGGIDSRSFFILPSREHSERIRNLILKQDVPGLFNAHILTINDFASRLLPGAAVSHPADAFRKKVLREVLQADEGLFRTFGALKDLSGFYDLLVDTLKEFKGGLLGIRELEARSQKLLKDPAFRSKFRDFTVLVKKYEAALSNMGLEEPEDKVARLLGRARPAPLAELVIFDGFYHFTRAQRKFIAYLCRLSSQVVVTLTLPDNFESRPHVFDYPMRTRRFLLAEGFRETRPARRKNRRTADASLQHLEKNIFLEKPVLFGGATSSIKVFEANGLRAEVEMIAREIRRLYRGSDLHYSDICIILRSIGGYQTLVQSIFSEFGIPVIVHEREKLIEHGLAAALFRFLSLLDEDWRREDLFYFLKSSYLRRAAPPTEVLALEALSLEKGVRSGRACWQELCAACSDAGPERLLRKVLEWEEGLRSAPGIRAFGAGVLSLVREFEIRPVSEDPGSADDEVFQSIREILETAEHFYREPSARPFSAVSFVRELKDSLKSGLYSLRPKGRNRVQVYDAVMAIPKEYRVVFIAGLLEKAFPQPVIEDPLFKDRERRVINGKDPVLEEKSQRVTGERYFFYIALTRAKDRLYLTYPGQDPEGKPSPASFFVEEARKCFSELEEIKRTAGDLVPDWNEWESERDVIQGLTEILFEPNASRPREPTSLPEPVFKALGEYLNQDVFRGVLRTGFSEPLARIRDPRVRRFFSGIEGPFSATRLETFATCAFKYFAGRVLKLREPMDGREFLEMGNVLHRVLEEFYREFSERGGSAPPWTDETEALQKLCEKLETQIQVSPFGRLPLFRRRIYEIRMRRILGLFVEQEKKFSGERTLAPTYFEFEFNDLAIGGEHGVKIQGKIDRVDVDPATRKALVIDYKLSKRPVSIREKFAKGLEFQIPLYLMAVRRLLNLDVIGGELRFLSSASTEGLYRESEREGLGLGPRKKGGYSEEEFEKLLEDTETLVRQAVGRLRSADISVKSKSCDFCAFSPVCRFEPWKLVYSENE